MGCKVRYWKIYKGMDHAKSNVRGTHEHGYEVLNAYSYMLEVANSGSKTTLSLDENGRLQFFFVSYAAWIIDFQEMRKVIAVDDTFLRSKYGGVLLLAWHKISRILYFQWLFVSWTRNMMPHMNIFSKYEKLCR